MDGLELGLLLARHGMEYIEGDALPDTPLRHGFEPTLSAPKRMYGCVAMF